MNPLLQAPSSEERPRGREVATKNILLWHVHGSYTTALLEGKHNYYLPVLPDRGPYGLGRARTWDWPENAIEITPHDAREIEFDLAIVQRPKELSELVAQWTGCRPGILPTIYLEHNTPQGEITQMRHLAADRKDVTIVHVTHFNDLFWDCGSARTRVIEHGIIDPGYRYTGEIERAAVAINEPVRRGRVTGTDLLPRFAEIMPVDLFGIGAGMLGGIDDPPQALLHAELPKRRAYVHPMRWTSLGLSLIEAMMLGMPAIAVATTDAREAVAPGCGHISTNVDTLRAALREYKHDPDRAREDGLRARAHACERFALARFLADWDAAIAEATA